MTTPNPGQAAATSALTKNEIEREVTDSKESYLKWLLRLLRVENEDKIKKPFKCPSCPKRFKCYANRLQHRKIHDPNRESFECKVCSKTFVSQIGFKNHEERVCKVG